MLSLKDQIRETAYGRQPLIYLHSPEEDRMVRTLEQLAGDGSLGDDCTVTNWSCVTGLTPAAEIDTDTRDPVQALQAITDVPRRGFYVMKDLSAFMDDPPVIRALRNAYFHLKPRAETFIVIVSPELNIPKLLEKEISLLQVPPPTADELLDQLLAVQGEYPDKALPESMHSAIALALKGLTLNETSHVMHRVFRSGRLAEKEVLEEIFGEKEMIVKKSGFLEFIPPHYDISQIGGLEALKDWLTKRAKVFNRDTVAAGLPVPRGILLMGVSGCGKSLCAKVVSSLWRVPLFRLDMNLVFSGLYGSPEAAFHHALRTVESVAPAVMWVDEIENGLGSRETKGADQQHVFSAFLTWMQEKPPLVFVAATANQIHLLPAEIIRKGRFDQVFFCDLPNDDERRAIIGIHVAANGGNSDDVDVNYLTVATEGWNGAEIEQAVISARIDAYQEDRPFTTDDVSRHVRQMVPLSETMAEQIKAIRAWAWGRATSATETKRRRAQM